MELAVGSEVHESLRVRRFDPPPSPEEFAAVIEPSNVPAVFAGAINDWPALQNWDPSANGLDYLEELIRSTKVEVMLSNTASIFYGDIRSHERVALPFSTFITFCKLHLQNPENPSLRNFVEANSESASIHIEEACSHLLDNLDQLYLAQVPILNSDSKESCPLENLRKDIQKPILLDSRMISSINLWMNILQSRSSTHYDPHHNLLCIVAGCKKVTLWPPSASAVLYPRDIYGEASNHSAIDFEKPDLSIHPRAKGFMKYAQKVILHPGDAVYIPEGWYHQVDSEDLTIAVNFWWKSKMMSEMFEHMDAYYLRRILNRLVEKEKVRIIMQTKLVGKPECRKYAGGTHELAEGSLKLDIDTFYEKLCENRRGDTLMEQVDYSTVNVLHELILLTHETINASGQNQASVPGSLEVPSNNSSNNKSDDDSFCLENDPFARIFSSVEPLELQKVLLAMVHYFPKTLEALIQHVLTPISAEVLTQKFDEMDEQTSKEQQSMFYHLFYSVFSDQYSAMDTILNRKEMFAFGAFQNVLNYYLGIDVSKPK